MILSAVGLYKEASKWFCDNIENNLQIFLDVPKEERINRDSATKKIYNSSTNFNLIYDDPRFITNAITNHNTTPERTANQIINLYFEKTAMNVCNQLRLIINFFQNLRF